jgi:23S rRNA-/tRNA-specific pseudouridylate synthase
MVIPQTPNPTPKMGITKILEIKKDKEDTVNLKLEILTGRTHQIRYHLSNHGLPIL